LNSETPVVRCLWGAMDLTTEVNEVCNRGNLILGGNTFGYLLFEVKKLEFVCLVTYFEQTFCTFCFYIVFK